MKCKIPEISWHNRDPVLSVDIQGKSERKVGSNVETYRLASGGTDSHVLIWYLNYNHDTGELVMDLAADLTRHQRAVNVVKFSPNSQMLASGDDESFIFIWKLKEESEPINIMEDTNDCDKETWLTMSVLRGHMEDVYDLSWSPNSLFLVSGSVDNTAMLWNVQKAKSLAILKDHKGFVQGVAWDPRNQFIATMCTDRYLRLFDIKSQRVIYRINKAILPVPEEHELHDKHARLFHDDTLQTFFRRLCFTPDGKLLITPSGVADYDGSTQQLHTSYIFSRHAFKQPAIVLPSPGQYTVAVGCCPVLYKLRPHSETNPPVVPLPYRMVFAVATRCSVYFYDTQQQPPFAVVSNIHYTRLTDITWSHNGRIVVVSSTDGFCSLITFDEGELGEEYAETAEDMLLREQSTITQVKRSHKKQSNNHSTMCNEVDDKPKECLDVMKPKNTQFNGIVADISKEWTDDEDADEDDEEETKSLLVGIINEKTENEEKEKKEEQESSKKKIVTEMEVDDELPGPPSSDPAGKTAEEVTKSMPAVIVDETKGNEEKEVHESCEKEIVIEMEVDDELPCSVPASQADTNVEQQSANEPDKCKDASSECNTPRHNYQTPTERTPRRVALRTFPRPNQKKKLLED